MSDQALSPSQAWLTIYSAAFAVCQDQPFATMGEGQVKAAILIRLLQSGFDVLEGSAKNVGKILSLQDGTIATQTAALPRMSALPGSKATRWSPDVRIWHPVKLMVEIQCRSVWGSQDALFSNNILNDLDRICSGIAQVFVFCCDLPIYRSLRGDKTETRGRRAVAPEIFGSLFPHHEELSGNAIYQDSRVGRYAIVLTAGITQSVLGVQRVVLVAVGNKGASTILPASEPALAAGRGSQDQ